MKMLDQITPITRKTMEYREYRLLYTSTDLSNLVLEETTLTCHTLFYGLQPCSSATYF